MADQSRFFPRPLYRRDVRWEPFCEETLPSRLYRPDAGLPPFLEPGDLSWIQWAQRRLAASSWPGYMPPPLFTATAPYPTPGMEQSRGVSEIRTGPESWKINLDVSCFSPREVTIRTREGYLEISGNHEDRQDEYGLVSKCFSRKYNRLPAGSDLRHIRSALSGGVLSVEAPLPSMAQDIPVEIIIPVQVEKRSPESREESKIGETTPPVSQENTEGQQAGTTFPADVQEKSNGQRTTASPLSGIQENREEQNGDIRQKNREEPSEAGDPSADSQENQGPQESLTAATAAERACSTMGAEQGEDRPMNGEGKGEEMTSQEEMAATQEAMLAAQANQDGVGQEERDPSQMDAQGSTVDTVQVEEKKQMEARWTHRDTKWMMRSTKWPSQQY